MPCPREEREKLEHYRRKSQVARFRLLNELISEKELDYKLVTSKLNVSAATIKAFKEQGIVEVIDVDNKSAFRHGMYMELVVRKLKGKNNDKS